MKELRVRGDAAKRPAHDQLPTVRNLDSNVLWKEPWHWRGQRQTIGRAIQLYHNRLRHTTARRVATPE